MVAIIPHSITIQAEGTPARTTNFHGQAYAGLELGQRYSLKVTNTEHRKILVVVTVDGLNVVDGAPGSSGGAGFVIGPNASYTIDGWRTSLEEVAAFRMTHAQESYAAGKGHPSNVGVIGMAVFGEKNYRPAPMPRPATMAVNRHGDDYLMGGDKSSGTMRSAFAGTGFGETRESRVTTTSFERGLMLDCHTIRYDNVEALVAKGILPPVETFPPDPFPADKPSQPAFCEPATIPFEIG